MHLEKSLDAGIFIAQNRVNHQIPMLGVVTALHCEAVPFIDRLKMKKIISQTGHMPFDMYKSSGASLCVCGTGPVNAAAGSAFFLAQKNSEWLLNVGMCGSNKNLSVGSVVYPNVLVDSAAGCTVYPEMLYKHEFTEGSLASFPRVINGGECSFDFFDMEAAFFYQTALKFLAPEKIIVLKIVSDHGADAGGVTKKKAAGIMENAAQKILPWLFEIMNEHTGEPLFAREEKLLLDAVNANLKLSFCQQKMLERAASACKNNNGTDLLIKILNENINVSLKSKNESKILFNGLTKRLFDLTGDEPCKT